MAEVVVFGLASKLLSTVASPAFEKAYQKGWSAWEARDELKKLRATIRTIRAVLRDADQRKQEHSEREKEWMMRVKGVLYDADDFFDGIATDDMLKQQLKVKENKFLYKVRVSCSKLNPIISSNSIANKVKDIRKSLDDISRDMAPFGYINFDREEPMRIDMRVGKDLGSLVAPFVSFVDSKLVCGRDEDKRVLLGMLFNDESEIAETDIPLTIAIVGIGGMGKTTLAQLVYNDEEVKNKFEKRWFACISDTNDDTVITGKIFQSICRKTYSDLTIEELQSGIRESIEGKKFLLVLDNVWDANRVRWQSQRSLLSGGAKGSMIIVTTRSLSVARVAGAQKTTHVLRGLSEEDSWNLFVRVAFSPGQEKDSRRISLGKEIVKKCANNPLAIKGIGNLLFKRSTMQEWKSFAKVELSKLGQNGDDPIMPILKLSYDHLDFNVKPCFAYCSLFPKDCRLYKEDLIYLWIAQGYINPNTVIHTVEEVGESCFLDLLRSSFFEECPRNQFGEQYYQMHDLIHDLAQHVAGDECSMFTKSSSKEAVQVARHVGVERGIDDSLFAAIINVDKVNHLRSFMFMDGHSARRLTLVEECANLKYLRTLSLRFAGIENVSVSIGELKHLRYLDISENCFQNLPDSITKLLNLCTLNISGCEELEVLPADFRKLVNLRHLINQGCKSLKYMPPGFKELTSLQRLDEFKVGGKMNQLNELEQMRLGGLLEIHFGQWDGKTVLVNDEWGGVESWQPPVNLEHVTIKDYKGIRIPNLHLTNVTCLTVIECHLVKCLPPFRHMPNLESLHLHMLPELEYIEEDDGRTDSDALFQLKELDLGFLSKLKGWMMERPTQMRYSSLAKLKVFALNAKFLSQILSTPLSSLKHLEIDSCEGLISFPWESLTSLSSLELLHIKGCNELTSLHVKSLTSLSSLRIESSRNLEDVVLAHLSNLKYLEIEGCRELGLWEEEKKCTVNWDSLPNLINLKVDVVPSPEELPNLLRNRQDDGILQITKFWYM